MVPSHKHMGLKTDSGRGTALMLRLAAMAALDTCSTTTCPGTSVGIRFSLMLGIDGSQICRQLRLPKGAVSCNGWELGLDSENSFRAGPIKAELHEIVGEAQVN